MQISVNRPDFTEEFKACIAKAKRKRVTHQLTITDVQKIGEEDGIFISVYVKARPVGRFIFIKEEDKAILVKKQIIERDYCPFEYAVSVLVKNLKRKKIKFILWD